jgi:hypothetical protein
MEIAMLSSKPFAPWVSKAGAGSKSVRLANAGIANGRLKLIDPPINRQIVPRTRNNSGKFKGHTPQQEVDLSIGREMTVALPR